MPPLVTSRSINSPQPTKSFSRVNSFKRDWGDDDELPKQNGLKGSSREIEWSASPEPVKRKIHVPLSKMVSPPSDPNETPADRRRKAILAAMSENTSHASSSSTYQSSSTINTLPSLSNTLQELPSVPYRAANLAMEVKKRQLPWEEELTTAKKAMRTQPTSGATKRSNSAGSSAAGLNIQQKISLSSEQQKVLTHVVAEGKNIFFTGSAGTGKSVLLREIIKNLRKKYAAAADAVAVTASTGIAACNIGGVTLHSFGGAGLGLEKADVLVGKIKKNKKAAARWLRTKVLIIDEVSMVDGEMFDKFCKIAQIMRKVPGKPWGGIQIIVTGDFFQLPPVTKGGAMPKFCFEAQTWTDTIDLSVNLTKVFRQKDQKFVDMLNEMRFGKLTPSSIAGFRALARPIHYDDGIEPTELFPRREDVDGSNRTRLDILNTDGWTFNSTDGGNVTDPLQREKLLSNFMAPTSIQLKVNAQVMMIKNLDETLVNGSMGKVIGFSHDGLFELDSSGKWKPDGILDDLDEEEKEKRLQQRASLEARLANGVKPWPVVQFKIPGGGVRDTLVKPDTFKNELPNGEIQASRLQLPLILAWAMSIHKSQGQTLDRVKVDLGKVFEKGQAYVALSRATSLQGLQVTGFTAEKVMAHRKVALWSASLRDLNS